VQAGETKQSNIGFCSTSSTDGESLLGLRTAYMVKIVFQETDLMLKEINCWSVLWKGSEFEWCTYSMNKIQVFFRAELKFCPHLHCNSTYDRARIVWFSERPIDSRCTHALHGSFNLKRYNMLEFPARLNIEDLFERSTTFCSGWMCTLCTTLSYDTASRDRYYTPPLSLLANSIL